MATRDYLMKNVRIGKVEAGKRNAGNYYLTCEIKVLDPRFRNARGETERIWYDEDPELIDMVRSVLPANGNDPQGNPWNGTDNDIDPSTFGMQQYNAKMQTLQNLNGVNWLLRANGKFLDYKLDGLYAMKFATSLIGNGTADNPQFHKDDYIMEPSGNYVKVYSEVRIFVQYFDEATNDFVNGMEPATRIKNKMRNMVPLAAVIRDNPKIVNPQYMNEYVIPTVTPITESAPAINIEPAAAAAPEPAVNELR